MATTDPDNIYSPDGGTAWHLPAVLSAMAESVQDALNVRANAHMGTSAERKAVRTTLPNGSLWADTGSSPGLYILASNSWKQVWPVTEPEQIAGRLAGGEARSWASGEVKHVLFGEGSTFSGSGGVTRPTPQRLEVPKDGWYIVTGTIRWGASANSGGLRQTRVTADEEVIASSQLSVGGSDRNIALTATTSISLKAGARIALQGYQDSGRALQDNPGLGNPSLSVAWVGAA